jgi:ligand-binding sensor domain-containing protein/signal transduction histidine kinase
LALRKIGLLIYCVFLFFLQDVLSQQARRYSFANFNINNGLAGYYVQGMMQDDQGFMWIGMIGGLQRFDGNRFITFRHIPSDSTSIPDNDINQLHLDKNKNLWLIFGNGKIGIFDTRRFVFHEVKIRVKDENSLKFDRKLTEDSDGNLTLVYYLHEVLTYNKRLNEFSSKHNIVQHPPNWKISNFAEDIATKKYYIATDSGMVVYDRRTREMSYRGHNIARESVIEQFGSMPALPYLLVDKKSRFWFQYWPVEVGAPVLYCFDLKADTVIHRKYNFIPLLMKYHEPRTILEQKNGTLWFSGLNLFAKYFEQDKSFQIVENGFSSGQGIVYSRINTLYEDREENVWVATGNNGIYIFNPSRNLFSSIKHINLFSGQPGEGSVMSFTHTNDGSVLTGTWGEGMYKYDQQMNSLPRGMAGVDVVRAYSAWCMLRLKDNKTIWMGIQPGIIVYDQASNSGKYYNPERISNRTVRQLAEDRYGNIWIGMQSQGVFKWTASKGQEDFNAGISHIEQIPRTLIEKISVDSKGYVWVCTMMEGVYKIDPSNDSIIEHLSEKGPPSKRLIANSAAAALEYNDSIMIIVSKGLNIYNTRSNTISHITSAEGLPSDMIMSIEKDRKGFLWMALLNGICRMNLAKKTFTYYDRNDGMANDNFTLASSYVLPDGRLLFGTSNDFVIFDPDDIVTTAKPPDVAITDFKILNRSFMVDSLLQLRKIELQHHQNSITISFSGLNYLNKNKLTYYHMLEGIDKEWKKANELNEAIYNYLPPATYTFKVKAETADGVSSQKTTRIVIKIFPPFWKTWWFYTMLILTAAILLYGFDRERMRKKEAIQKMRSDIASNLHEEVNSALNKINILSEMAKIKADTNPEKSKEYFEQIHSKSHNMIIAMDDMLWSINPENDSMRRTAERMKEYVDALKNRHNVNIDVLVDKNVLSLELNMKLRHDAFLLFKDGIKGVVQAGATNCRVHIGYEKNCLIYMMQFDNKGCDMHELNNLFHSLNMQKRLEEINARLRVQVHKSSSTFELELPVTFKV